MSPEESKAMSSGVVSPKALVRGIGTPAVTDSPKMVPVDCGLTVIELLVEFAT
jgi:hypothetical protein